MSWRQNNRTSHRTRGRGPNALENGDEASLPIVTGVVHINPWRLPAPGKAHAFYRINVPVRILPCYIPRVSRVVFLQDCS